MEGSCSTGQNPQWAVVPVEEEEEEEVRASQLAHILDTAVFSFVGLKKVSKAVCASVIR
jgi:hypothetical protein